MLRAARVMSDGYTGGDRPVQAWSRRGVGEVVSQFEFLTL